MTFKFLNGTVLDVPPAEAHALCEAALPSFYLSEDLLKQDPISFDGVVEASARDLLDAISEVQMKRSAPTLAEVASQIRIEYVMGQP